MKIIIQIFAFFILGTSQIWAETPEEATINWSSAKEIKGLIKLVLDPEDGEVTTGPNFAYSDKSLSNNFSEIYLSRVVNPKDEEFYTLFITALYNDQDWRAYNLAIDKEGQKFPMVTLSKNENVSRDNATYKYEEKLAITLDFIIFADASTSGLELTISGNKTSQIKIPPGYFLAMLQSM